MNSHDDAIYRLDLARGYAKEANTDFRARHWWSCVSNAQVAIENAGKAIIECYEPAEKVHEVSPQMTRLLGKGLMPATIQKTFEELVPIFTQHGRTEHIQSTYGDDRTRTPPWKIYDKAKATESVSDMRKVILMAQKVIKQHFGK